MNFPCLLRRFAIAMVAGTLLLTPGLVPHAIADSMPTDRAGLDAYIRDFIMKNPDILREALLKSERDEETARAKHVLSEYKKDIYADGSPEIGNPEAKVTIVEFYDYNCPYCRATYPVLKDFLKANPDTKLVLKDVASLGKDSEAVARVVIAARAQGKFEPLHDALMTRKGKVTEAQAIEAATKLGLDIERLKRDASAAQTADVLSRAQDLATRLNVAATPLYIVGYHGISGAPDDLVAQLTEHVAEIRKSGCDVC